MHEEVIRYENFLLCEMSCVVRRLAVAMEHNGNVIKYCSVVSTVSD